LVVSVTFVVRIKRACASLLQALQDQRLEIGRQLVRQVLSLRRRDGRLHELLEDRFTDALVDVERLHARDQLIEHDTQRVDVRAVINLPTDELLWRHVLGRADGVADAGLVQRAALVVDELGHAEVEELDDVVAPILLREEDVLGLEVSVNDRRVVHGDHRVGDLQPDAQCAIQARDADGGEQLGDAAPLEELHDVAGEALSGEEVGHLDDVLVADLIDRARFTLEALDRLRVLREPPTQHLERDASPEDLVLREVDAAHAALAEQIDELVVADGLADLRHAAFVVACACACGPGARAAVGGVSGLDPLAFFCCHADRGRGHLRAGHTL
jgi:hypothetical protein